MKPHLSILRKIIRLEFQRVVSQHTQVDQVIHLQGYKVAKRTHLSMLKRLAEQNRGYKGWNQWRRENPTVTPDLSEADLSGLDLGLFDLREANLASAVLRNTRFFAARLDNADLSNANLIRADLSSAQLTSCNLDKANLIRADLQGSNLRKACLVAANLCGANLSKATLNFANLIQVKLTKADLTSTVMRAVNLQDADLSAVQALGTNFEGAVLTGACLQNWNSNDKTILDDVQCEYVHLERKTDGQFSGRLPKERAFSPGEFAEQFQRSSKTTELFLPNGLAELPLSLESLTQRYPNKTFVIQEIEAKERNAVLVRLEAMPAQSQESTEKFYKKQVQLAEAAYELQAITSNPYNQTTLTQYRVDKKLTQGERQRLEQERSALQATWDLTIEKLEDLWRALAIEAGATHKFQLQQQIKWEEEEKKRLNAKLAEIERMLDYQEDFSTTE